MISVHGKSVTRWIWHRLVFNVSEYFRN